MSLSIEIDRNMLGLEVFIGGALDIEVEGFVHQLNKEVKLLRLANLSDEAIFASLQADFRQQGRVFGSFETAIKAQVSAMIQAASNGAQVELYREQGFAIEGGLWLWTVINRTNPCPGCLGREGRIETMDTWQMIGEPGTGWSVCKGHCYCIMSPQELGVPGRVDIN